MSKKATVLSCIAGSRKVTGSVSGLDCAEDPLCTLPCHLQYLLRIAQEKYPGGDKVQEWCLGETSACAWQVWSTCIHLCDLRIVCGKVAVETTTVEDRREQCADAPMHPKKPWGIARGYFD